MEEYKLHHHFALKKVGVSLFHYISASHLLHGIIGNTIKVLELEPSCFSTSFPVSMSMFQVVIKLNIVRSCSYLRYMGNEKTMHTYWYYV